MSRFRQIGCAQACVQGTTTETHTEGHFLLLTGWSRGVFGRRARWGAGCWSGTPGRRGSLWSWWYAFVWSTKELAPRRERRRALFGIAAASVPAAEVLPHASSRNDRSVAVVRRAGRCFIKGGGRVAGVAERPVERRAGGASFGGAEVVLGGKCCRRHYAGGVFGGVLCVVWCEDRERSVPSCPIIQTIPTAPHPRPKCWRMCTLGWRRQWLSKEMPGHLCLRRRLSRRRPN